MKILVTGATGYIGGRLLSVLEAEGADVRCMARRPEYLRPRVGERTEVVQGDVLDPESLARALEGVDAAFYLVHGMGAGDDDYEARDREAARHFAAAARTCGVRRIVYLGGLGHGPSLSKHLRSRQEVGRILRESGVSTVELRTSVIIGSESLSFAMVRALVEKLPVMVTPRWVRTLTQPIAVEDVIDYLRAALEYETNESVVFEVGGRDRVSYGDLMQEYARQRGLRRWMIPVPFLTPAVSSLWLRLVTPLYARVGRELIEGLRNETVVTDDRALRELPVRPRGVREAIHRALCNEDRRVAETRWSDALSASRTPSPARRLGARLVDSHARHVDSPPAAAFKAVQRVGGRRGWYHVDWMWAIRGYIDLLVGGPGLRRGRRDPDRLQPGDAVDFWRVEAVEPDHLLRLRAEMRLPGRAWLIFEVEPDGRGSRIRQTALFDPVGLLGLLYWAALYPLHRIVFQGMLRGMARAAAREA